MPIDKVVQKLARMRYDFRKYYPLESDGPCNGVPGNYSYDLYGILVFDPNYRSFLFDANRKPVYTPPYRQDKGKKTTHKRKYSS